MPSAGELEQRVSVQLLTEQSDGHDGFVDTWSLVRRRLAAKVVPLAGRELERARAVDPRSSHEVTFRYWRQYSQELTSRSRVIYHDVGGDRTLEPVEPPREVIFRDTLSVVCREAA